MSKSNRIRTTEAIQHQARELRKEMTPAEQTLWKRLRNRQLDGAKFRRQHPVGPYIVDFYCAEFRLVVELDGDIHAFQAKQDLERTQQLKEEGYRVIRFKNQEVLENLDTVLLSIRQACK